MPLNAKIDALDIAVLVVYFVSVIITGLVAMFAVQRNTVSGFFLAGRLMTWLPIGASLYASNIGSEHYIGLAGSGAATGIGIAALELNASVLLQLLGWVFLPVYISSGVCTLPEYMKKRFGGKRIQIYLACLSLLLYVLTKISVNLYSGSLFLQEALNWNIWPSIFLILGMTSLITLTGGLAAVIYTDTLQFFIMIIGAFILAILGYVKVGGFPGVLNLYGEAIAPVDLLSDQGGRFIPLHKLASSPGVDPSLSCSLPSPKAFKLLKEIDDPDMPWLGFVIGQTAASLWYWCADQMMVQRVLSAKNLSHAQGATLMTGLIKLLPLFIMVIPGMISRILFPDEIACIPGDHCLRVCGQRSGCTNLAYPKLVLEVMPTGLRGLMLSVMLAALISDMTSIFNSASTLFAVDVYKQFRKRAGEGELMLAGRLFVVFLVVVSVAWIPVVQELQGSQLYVYIQSVSNYLAPPVAAVYLLAVLWPRCNELGAFWALMFGLVLGIVRLILSVVYNDPICGEVDTRPWIVGQLHYMYFAFLSFASTFLVMVAVSFIGKRPDAAQIVRLTYFTAWVPPEPIEERTKEWSEEDINTMNDTPVGSTLNGEVSEQYVGSDSFRKSAPEKPHTVTKTDITETRSYEMDESESTLDCLGECECRSRAGQCVQHLFRWLCGCEDRPCPLDEERRFLSCISCGKCNEKTDDYDSNAGSQRSLPKTQAIDAHRITSLDQSRRDKYILRVGLAALLSLTLFGFFFFTFYFGLLEAGPLHVKPFSNVTLPLNVTMALDLLVAVGIVSV
ncbi:unnamed protein product [Dicrocoelium dendriticum]|nr:unnamed protein product [Dicrocoelium dendriticum]